MTLILHNSIPKDPNTKQLCMQIMLYFVKSCPVACNEKCADQNLMGWRLLDLLGGDKDKIMWQSLSSIPRRATCNTPIWQIHISSFSKHYFELGCKKWSNSLPQLSHWPCQNANWGGAFEIVTRIIVCRSDPSSHFTKQFMIRTLHFVHGGNHC